jgi:hypothetical protein
LKQKILTHKIIGVPEVDIVCIGAKTVAFLSEHRILETQLLGLLYGGGASFVQKWSMPWMSANI